MGISKTLWTIVALLAASCAVSGQARSALSQQNHVDLVNVFTGTSNSRWMQFPGRDRSHGTGEDQSRQPGQRLGRRLRVHHRQHLRFQLPAQLQPLQHERDAADWRHRKRNLARPKFFPGQAMGPLEECGLPAIVPASARIQRPAGPVTMPWILLTPRRAWNSQPLNAPAGCASHFSHRRPNASALRLRRAGRREV